MPNWTFLVQTYETKVLIGGQSEPMVKRTDTLKSSQDGPRVFSSLLSETTQMCHSTCCDVTSVLEMTELKTKIDLEEVMGSFCHFCSGHLRFN